jgi:hypothetical protein
MSENGLILILTCITAAATVAYTFTSMLLWKTTRSSTDISRQLALSNMWIEMNRYIELARQENRPESEFLRKFSNILAELLIANLIKDLRADGNANLRIFNRKIENLIESSDFDTSQIEWFAPFLNNKDLK